MQRFAILLFGVVVYAVFFATFLYLVAFVGNLQVALAPWLPALAALVPAAVEELLRYVPLGVGSSFARYAKEDVEVGGVLVRAGEPVLGSLSSANRDGAVFADPDRLDLQREQNPHLGFGHGVHHCVGAQLARMELQVAVSTLVTRLPGLRLAVPEAELELVKTKLPELMAGVAELKVPLVAETGVGPNWEAAH